MDEAAAAEGWNAYFVAGVVDCNYYQGRVDVTAMSVVAIVASEFY